MLKAIGSKIDLNNFENNTSNEYNQQIKDLISNNSVSELSNYYQHMNTSRLQHSVNVSFHSFRIARFFGADARAAARAGLLHDLYFYEFKDNELTCRAHSKLHSELALENAKMITTVSEKEEDIIINHMWPMTSRLPRHLESYIVTLADKICTTLEVMSAGSNILKKRIRLILRPDTI